MPMNQKSDFSWEGCLKDLLQIKLRELWSWRGVQTSRPSWVARDKLAVPKAKCFQSELAGKRASTGGNRGSQCIEI